MRIVLSADMEGIAQIHHARELLAWCPEYWDTGRRKLTDDVIAAATGLLEGGATEVVVLDNHASGHPCNILIDRVPAGVSVATCNVFDLPEMDADGMLQVGYHPRAGVAGFAPHTYIPGLRLWVDDEEISESHGRAWAAGTPLLGISGHASHGHRLGSLSAVPFLAVQAGEHPHRAAAVFPDAAESAEAIRSFARDAMRGLAEAPLPTPPARTTFTAVLDEVDDSQVATMVAGGWTRTGVRAFAAPLDTWAAAREPLAAAMSAALAPFLDELAALDLTTRDTMLEQHPATRDRLTSLFLDRIRTPARA
jgi:D-amino peptidase